MEKQCKSTFMNGRGKLMRCEDLEGHNSVHQCGNDWWPNPQSGFPLDAPPHPSLKFVIGLLVAVIVATLAVLGLILHFKP